MEIVDESFATRLMLMARMIEIKHETIWCLQPRPSRFRATF